MPRNPSRLLRADPAARPQRAAFSTLLTTVCPGPPACGARHTYLFLDGLDLIGRSHAGAAGDHPSRLLRPGGPLYPTDQARRVAVATYGPDSDVVAAVEIRIRLRGRTVVWGDLQFPGPDDRVVEEVRFDLPPYLAELERGYARWREAGPWGLKDHVG